MCVINLNIFYYNFRNANQSYFDVNVHVFYVLGSYKSLVVSTATIAIKGILDFEFRFRHFRYFQRQLVPTKLNLYAPLICTILVSACFYNYYFSFVHYFSSSENEKNWPLLRWYENVYLCGLILLEIYNLLIHNALGFSVKFPFLPLLLTSVYCAVGIMWSWLLFYYSVLTENGCSKVATG